MRHLHQPTRCWSRSVWPFLAAAMASCYFHLPRSVTTKSPMKTQMINFSLIIFTLDNFDCAFLLLSLSFMTNHSVMLCYFHSFVKRVLFPLPGNPLATHSPVLADSSHGRLLILDPLPTHSVSTLPPLLQHCCDLLINSNSALHQLYSNYFFYFCSFSITSMNCKSDTAGLSPDGYDSAQTLEAQRPCLIAAKPCSWLWAFTLHFWSKPHAWHQEGILSLIV